MRNSSQAILLVTVLGSAASCAFTAPYRNSGPAISKEGVQVAIVGERCFVNRTGEQYPTTVNDDELNLGMRLQVKNEASQPAVLSLDRLRLSETVAGERTVMTPMESESLALAPGEIKVVSLHFEQTGALDCHHEMALDAPQAVAIGDTEVEIDPIRFLASH
jgi:hypothetical protein